MRKGKKAKCLIECVNAADEKAHAEHGPELHGAAHIESLLMPCLKACTTKRKVKAKA